MMILFVQNVVVTNLKNLDLNVTIKDIDANVVKHLLQQLILYFIVVN